MIRIQIDPASRKRALSCVLFLEKGALMVRFLVPHKKMVDELNPQDELNPHSKKKLTKVYLFSGSAASISLPIQWTFVLCKYTNTLQR